MSHFAVAVLTAEGQDVDGLLAPYMENCCDTPDYRYMEFYDGAEVYRDDYENGTVSKLRCPDGTLMSKYDKSFAVRSKDKSGLTHERYEYPEGYEVVEIPCKDAYKTIEDYLQDWHGYEKDPMTGKYGYWQNPNAKWDWYDEDGGRFRKYAEELIGAQSIAVADIKFDADEHREAAEAWWQANMDADGKPKTPFALWENDGMNHDQFVESRAHVSFRAVVTPDGKWHEPGEMGWFGISSESADEMFEWRLRFEERFLEPYRDCTLTVVDCHI